MRAITAGSTSFGCYLAAATVLTLAAGCGGEGVDSPTASVEPIVRDSAGIRIVEHRIDPEAVPVFAVVDSVPDLRIGEEGRGEAFLFSRLTDALSLDDETFAVLEGQAAEIRIFDGTGAHLRTLGGSGRGPGEFQGLSAAAGVAGDTLFLWDSRTQRVTMFDWRDGVLIESRRLIADGEYHRYAQRMNRLADGSYLTSTTLRAPSTGVPPPPSDYALKRDSSVVRWIGTGGEELDTLMLSPGWETIRVTTHSGGAGDQTVRTSVFPRPFGRQFIADVGNGRVAMGANDEFAVTLIDLPGRDEVRFTWAVVQRDVRPQMIEAERDWMLGSEPTQQQRDYVEAAFVENPLPETLPAFRDLEVSTTGNVWVAAYRTRDEQGPHIWWVFTPTGGLLGKVETPDGFTVSEIGPDYLLGWERDEFDVPTVVRYRMRSPE